MPGAQWIAPLLAGTLLLGAVSAAGAQQQRPRFGGNSGTADTTRGDSRSLRASVYTDRTQYSPRRGVEIYMRLTNVGKNIVQFPLNNTQEYDVLIRDARTGTTVWQWSRQPGTPARERRTIRVEPGQSRNYRVLWDQTDNEGRQVRPGVYRIEATVYPQNPVTTEVHLSGTQNEDRPQPGVPRSPRPQPGVEPVAPGDLIPRPRPQFPPSTDRPSLPPGAGSSLRAELRVDPASPRPGQSVTIAYTVSNPGPRPQTLQFSSGKQFDVVVRSGRTGQVVWRLSDGRRYTMALAQWMMRPGEQRAFTAQWQSERSLPDGAYEITAFLTPMGGEGDGVALARASVRIGASPGGLDRRGGLSGRLEGNDSPPIRLRDLLSGDPSYLGKRVTLRGAYRGWRGGEGPPPVKRGDWVVESEGRTLYVTGPMPTANIGESVTVTATVRRTVDGRIYLEAQ